jgi:chromosomal replication initiator protein
MKATWDDIKHRLSGELPANSFSLWIDPISFVEKKGSKIVLACPNKFSRNWVMENYSRLIRQAFQDTGAGHLDLVLNVQPVQRGARQTDVSPDPDQLLFPNMDTGAKRGDPCFNRAFTFDRFIVGRSNEFAYSATKAFANGGSWNYNSLLMLSSTGLGKTHLSQAAGNAILHTNPNARVRYVTAEQFTNEMIYSLKNNCIEEFKNKYRRLCDVLLLDEVHFFSGKRKTQIELGHTLDALVGDNKKVIFTSSVPPKDMPSISKELSSRLTSGLVTKIHRPDHETRIKILTKKASEHNMRLSEEIVHLLASHLKRDVRQMESALNCLRAKSELLKAKIDLDLAKDVLNCLVSNESAVTSDHIKKLICKYYKVDPDMLASKSRKKIHSHPRNIYAYLCRRHTNEALEKIAKAINRSHSTVVYASELIEKKIKADAKIRHEVDFLDNKVEQLKK